MAQPILHHLNADTSWLLQIPRSPRPSGPLSSPTPCPSSRRRYFNVLLDPWLSGTQSDVASWFSTQWHAESSAYGSVGDVERLCARMEGEGDETEVEAIVDGDGDGADRDKTGSLIDAVAISHEFTDHCESLACSAILHGRGMPGRVRHAEQQATNKRSSNCTPPSRSSQRPKRPSWSGDGPTSTP